MKCLNYIPQKVNSHVRVARLDTMGWSALDHVSEPILPPSPTPRRNALPDAMTNCFQVGNRSIYLSPLFLLQPRMGLEGKRENEF